MPRCCVHAAARPAPGTPSCSSRRSLGIAAVVLLIVWAKFHPFLALMLGTAVLGAVAVRGPARHRHELHHRAGHDVRQRSGLLIALGAMLGKLLADSGGAEPDRRHASSAGSGRGRCRGRWR